MKKIVLTGIFMGILSAYALSGSTSSSTPNALKYAEYLADKKVVVRQRPVENYVLEDNVLRQEVIGIVIRLTSLNFRTVDQINLPELYTCENMFADVQQNRPNTWACRSIETAVRRGIITTKNQNFRPESHITRAEALSILLGSVHLMPTVRSGEDWAAVVIDFALKNHLIGEAEKAPNETITRGELFRIVAQVIRILYQQEIEYTNNLFQ
jgi:hypothetical protein